MLHTLRLYWKKMLSTWCLISGLNMYNTEMELMPMKQGNTIINAAMLEVVPF